MATAAPSQAEDLFTCSFCFEEFKDPRSLNCLHTFCLHCLDDIERRLPVIDIVRCPICQQETPLPDRGVNGLKKDFKIEQMKELLDITTKKANEGHEGGRMCDACKGNNKGVAAFHCTSCLVFLCEKCVDKHSLNVMFRDHTVNAVPTNVEYCMVHMGQAVGYVCQCEPDILLCALCIMDHDKEHEVQTLSRARHTLLLDTLGVVNDAKKYLQGHLEDINRMTNSYEAMLIKVERRIREQAKRLMNEVKRKEAEMIREAHDTVKEVLTKYQADSTISQLRYTERVEDYINGMIQESDDTGYLQNAKLQREFLKFRGNIRPKVIPETGIVFVVPATLPPIQIGHLQGISKSESRKNDGLSCKNRPQFMDVEDFREFSPK